MHFNLNALLALLSKILRALLVVIISQIICQQKWGWYSNKRIHPLSDLQHFNSGSRGSLGALQLIPTVILKDTVTLIAAVVLVVSFLIGPFVQQASRTTPCLFPAPGLNASLPYAHYVPRRGDLSLAQIGQGGGVQGSGGDVLPDAVVAILSSVTAPNGTENQIRGNCATGTCTFRDADQEEAAPTYPIEVNSATHSTVAMCDRCIDIASLILRNYNLSAREVTFTLPNEMNITYSGAPKTFAMIRPSANLQWLGDLLTPELRAMSRWAYVNTTFLTVSGKNVPVNETGVTAAVCLLYPCVRTYVSSITNNELAEEEVSSQVMEISKQLEGKVASSQVTKISGGKDDWWGRMSAQEQYEAHYAAVKSPCQVGGQAYDETLNTTILSSATSLELYNYTDSHRMTYLNISTPESCIYRHDVQFVNTISKFLNKEIFNGSCMWYKTNICRKDSDDVGILSNLGVRVVLEKLIEGDRAYSNVTLWFSAFSNAMTSRFRFQYGGAAFDASLSQWGDQNLPLGEVQGIAWQTESCVSAHRDWLALPICLTAITTLLMIWMIASNWRHRRIRPIWKDNLLPLLFYRHNIDSENSGALPWRCDNITELEDKAQFMEASEMEKIAKKTLVTFQWSARKKLDGSLGKTDTSTIALQHMEGSSTQRSSYISDAEPLLASTNT